MFHCYTVTVYNVMTTRTTSRIGIYLAPGVMFDANLFPGTFQSLRILSVCDDGDYMHSCHIKHPLIVDMRRIHH